MTNFPLSQCRDKHIIEHAASIRWLSSNHPVNVPKVVESLNQSGYRVDKIDPTPQSIEFLDGISRGSTSVGSPVASYAIYSHDISSEVAQIHDFDGGDAPIASEQVSELLQQEPASNVGISVRLADGKLAVYTLAQHMRNQSGQGGTVVIAGIDKSGRTEAKTCQSYPQLDQSVEVHRTTAQLEQIRANRNQNAETILLDIGGNVQSFDARARGIAARQGASTHQHHQVMQDASRVKDHLTISTQSPNTAQRSNNPLQISWPGAQPRNEAGNNSIAELSEARPAELPEARPRNEAQRGNNSIAELPGAQPAELPGARPRTGIEGWLTLFNRSFSGQ
jgi:hypothetical protein